MRFFIGREIFFQHRTDRGIYWSRGVLKDIGIESFMILYQGKKQIYNSEDLLQVRESKPEKIGDLKKSGRIRMFG